MQRFETRKRSMIRYVDGQLSEAQDEIAEEYPLTIEVDGEEFATMVCTPTHLEELVVGFLASEGLIHLPDEIASVVVSEQRGYAYVKLKTTKKLDRGLYSKRFIGSCCGKSRQFYLHNDMLTAKTSTTRQTVAIRQCFALLQQLSAGSDVFRRTGGVHNAALCTPEAAVAVRTDIGRHNALDKIYGHCLQNAIPTGDKIVAFSGRISSEVLLKVAKLGAGIVLSKSAPTTLAIELAEDLGITTVGFIRGNSLNVYSHPHRVVL